ncbi:hypothetical protein BCR34DRAFT_587728 [Clohesyomyces aquaticus]|uniref:Uncharacterized protein n=1 Tax=Clohesyomyces aquaticus TaxID=1231657 RepID=A0A1Y1ZNC4_9PLEO|nr:hypothetical protein BCR34DRAFT_587728 [Clohesyomyces aquaticus]
MDSGSAAACRSATLALYRGLATYLAPLSQAVEAMDSWSQRASWKSLGQHDGQMLDKGRAVATSAFSNVLEKPVPALCHLCFGIRACSKYPFRLNPAPLKPQASPTWGP